jgi:PTS system mannose-specific IIA component
MIGLVVVTHGRLAEEFIAAAEHVVGRLDNARAVSIGPEDDMEMRRKEIIAAAKACDTGSGVMILTDMFGGTPSNLAISVMGGAKIEVIAGVNLPMLIKLAEVRGKLPIAEAALAAQEAGRKYISVASALLQRAE